MVRPDPGRGRRARVPSPMASARVHERAHVQRDAWHLRRGVPVGGGAPSRSAVPRRLLPGVARRPRAIAGRSLRARAGRARCVPRWRAPDCPRPRAAGRASPSAHAPVRSHCGGTDAGLAGPPGSADPGHAPPGSATPVRDWQSRRGLRGTDGTNSDPHAAPALHVGKAWDDRRCPRHFGAPRAQRARRARSP